MATELYNSNCSLATPVLPIVLIIFSPSFSFYPPLPFDFYLHFYDLVLSMFYLCSFLLVHLHPFALGSVSISKSVFSRCEAEPSS
jgi:hypothetical protein